MKSPVPVHTWLAEPLDEDVARFVERASFLPDAAAIAVMPDIHLAPPACVGMVIATRRFLYPELLGSDLGCGVCAVELDASVSMMDAERCTRVLDGFARAVPVLRRRAPFEGLDPEGATDEVARLYVREGRWELGTIGRGNHFLELHTSREGTLWVVAHSGSRAVGPGIQRLHQSRATAKHKGFAALEAERDEGAAYLRDVTFALALAQANRREILRAALDVLADVIGALPSGEVIDCQHDAVLRETHAMGEVFVHRKGAIALPRGARAIVPGSMGTETYVVTGRGEPRSLGSSAHGAGRSVPRSVARRRFDRADLARSMRGICFDARKVDALRDESPEAYKDVRAVMRAQRALVSVDTVLMPLVVHKGG